MSETSLTFRELIELIDTSVKSGKINKDYPDFLKSCRDFGVSSYILNTIIIKAKENCNKDDSHVRELDYAFFVPPKPKREKIKTEVPKEIQVNTQTEKKKSKFLWPLILFLLLICAGETIYIFNIIEDNKLYSRNLEIANSKNVLLGKVLADINKMTLSEDSLFGNWQSSNHDKSSESHNNYNFTAAKGDKISFNYYVSSESGYDYLIITITGDSISSNQLVKISGDSHNSHAFVFEKEGKYNLQVKYTKDSSINKNNDNAGVTNICLHRNYKNILEKIHVICNKSITEE